MNPIEYHTLRKEIGTQRYVAERLGISPRALRDRETSGMEIRDEMVLALKYLHLTARQVKAKRTK